MKNESDAIIHLTDELVEAYKSLAGARTDLWGAEKELGELRLELQMARQQQPSFESGNYEHGRKLKFYNSSIGQARRIIRMLWRQRQELRKKSEWIPVKGAVGLSGLMALLFYDRSTGVQEIKIGYYDPATRKMHEVHTALPFESSPDFYRELEFAPYEMLKELENG